MLAEGVFGQRDLPVLNQEATRGGWGVTGTILRLPGREAAQERWAETPGLTPRRVAPGPPLQGVRGQGMKHKSWCHCASAQPLGGARGNKNMDLFAFVTFEAGNCPPNHFSCKEGVCWRGLCCRSEGSRVKTGSPGKFYISAGLGLNVANGEGRGAIPRTCAGSLAACPEREGNKTPRALSVTPMLRIEDERVQSAVSLRGSDTTCSFPRFPARSHPPSGAGTARSAQNWGSLQRGRGEIRPRPCTVPFVPSHPPSSPPAKAFGSSGGEIKNENIKKPTQGNGRGVMCSLMVLPPHQPGVPGAEMESDPHEPLIGCMKGPKHNQFSCFPPPRAAPAPCLTQPPFQPGCW